MAEDPLPLQIENAHAKVTKTEFLLLGDYTLMKIRLIKITLCLCCSIMINKVKLPQFSPKINGRSFSLISTQVSDWSDGKHAGQS